MPVPILVLVALLALPMQAVVADDCAAPQTNMQMQDCAGRDYKAADADLNAAYGEVMAKLKAMDADLAKAQAGGGLAGALRDAQRAWIQFRDGQCGWEAAFFRGGSMQPLIQTTCLTELTRARTAQLRQTWKSYGAGQ